MFPLEDYKEWFLFLAQEIQSTIPPQVIASFPFLKNSFTQPEFTELLKDIASVDTVYTERAHSSLNNPDFLDEINSFYDSPFIHLTEAAHKLARYPLIDISPNTIEHELRKAAFKLNRIKPSPLAQLLATGITYKEALLLVDVIESE